MERFPLSCPGEVTFLLTRLEDAGHEAYVVGGCVRDALLGIQPHDWDITTSASPDEVKAALSGLRIVDTGLRHGTVTAVLGSPYEITTFRVDGKYSDGRRPDTVRFSRRLEDDLSRRDFTVNAMAWSPTRGLVDCFGGMADLHAGIIRCVGDPEQRMQEDALRVMRAVRFQSQLGFSIEPKTRLAVEGHVPRLSLVSPERIGSEFRRTVTAPFAARAIRENTVLFRFVTPGCESEPALRALESAEQTETLFPAPWADEPVRLALFFHCLGEDASRPRMRSLKFSRELTEQVCQLVTLHNAALDLTRPGVKRWMAKLSPNQLRRLLKVKACLLAAQTGAKDSERAVLTQFWDLVQQLRQEGAACVMEDLAVHGKDLIAAGIAPGRHMGAILDALLEEVIEEQTPNEPDALLHRAQELNKRGD